MTRNSIDDFGKPFEPATPEEFIQRGEEAFHSWWSELAPPGSIGGLQLDYENSRSVWAAAYEFCTAFIMLIFDGAETNAQTAHSTGEMHLACVIDRHHNGSISLLRRDFTEWVARHEDHIRHEYNEAESSDERDMLTVWIGREPSPLTEFPINRARSTSTAILRSGADEHFATWWKQLRQHAPGTLAFMNLDRNEAEAVWRVAYVKLWEDLEVVHDMSKAFAEVVAEKAQLELGYIVDRFHNGKLSVEVDDVMKYWCDDYVLQRIQTGDVLALHVRRVKQAP